MAKLYAMYKRPNDAQAFDRYYYATHVPIARKVPGLRHYEVTSGNVAAVGGGDAQYHLIAVLTFDSVEAITAALASPEGQATAADLSNFATGGVDLYVADTKAI